jgi:2-dehydro-3-deoxyphosphogluconate aldolase/(4S)-4-hydroxy-2-oxoglutarate aldolase
VTPTDRILHSACVAIIRAGPGTDLAAVAGALIQGGVTTLEITLNTPGALAAIEHLRTNFPTDLLVGAGTILNAADVAAAAKSGAQFIVTPTLQFDSIAACRQRSLPIFCGCSSPTEMLAAHRAGADFIKLFPATRYGPQYIRDVLAPLPMLRIVPTGGVNADNVATWLAAGAPAVAVGSQLVDPKLIAARDYDALTEKARTFLTALNAARSPH